MKVKRFSRSFTAAQRFFKKATIRGTDTFLVPLGGASPQLVLPVK